MIFGLPYESFLALAAIIGLAIYKHKGSMIHFKYNCSDKNMHYYTHTCCRRNGLRSNVEQWKYSIHVVYSCLI